MPVHRTFLAAAVLLVVIATGGRLAAALLTRFDFDADRAVQLLGFGWGNLAGVAVVGSFGIGLVLDPGYAVAATVDSLIVGAVLNAVFVAAVATLALAVNRRAFRPVVERLRAGEYETPEQHLDRYRLVTAVALFLFALGVEAVRTRLLPVHPAWLLPAAVALYGIRNHLVYPLAMPPNGVRLRNPTDAERRRIEQCFERIDGDPGWIAIAASEGNSIPVNATGFGVFRATRVTESFLDRVDDETLAVALAQARARADWGYLRYLTATEGAQWLLWAAIGGFVLIVATAGGEPAPQAALLVGVGVLSLVGHLVAAALGRRTTYRVDDRVASSFGAGVVREAYDRLGTDVNYHTPGRDLPGSTWFLADPPVHRRIERLAASQDGDSRSGAATR